MNKSQNRQVIPVLGKWYHPIANKQHELDHRLFCLCVKLETQEVAIFSIYVRVNDEVTTYQVRHDEMKEAYWLKTNPFHQFCLGKLSEMLAAQPSLEELRADPFFLLCFDAATLFRVYKAKTEHDAIDYIHDFVNRQLNDKLRSLKYKHQLNLVFRQLLKEYDLATKKYVK